MVRAGLILSLPLAFILWSAFQPMASQTKEEPAYSNSPQFTKDNELVFPKNYREWIYLSSGLDMNYNPAFQKMNHSMFDNVFVNPEAYKAFLQTGTWPDKTMLVLEARMASAHGSINKNGHFQAAEVMGIEVHVKDEAHIPGKWAFYGFDEEKPATMISKDMPCYSCHEQHGAVDTTFTQFYPTLIEIAKKKGTLSGVYVKEEAAAASGKDSDSKKH